MEQNFAITRVMIVEDEPVILRHLKKKIEEIDSEAVVFAAVDNPMDALAILETECPDILFTDIEMPEMNGLALIKRVKAVCPSVQIVVISGYNHFHYAQSALRMGVVDYLLKPLAQQDLEISYANVKQRVNTQKKLQDSETSWKKLGLSDLLSKQDQGNVNRLVQKVQRYIVTNFNKPVSAQLLADEFNYSQVHISKAFKQQYGLTPIRYQTEVRMQRAKELLLAHQNADIKIVASAVGYEDSRYFSRTFRQIVGMAPSEFVQKFH